MLTNLLIASACVFITLVVILNFSRLFEAVERLSAHINQCKSFFETLIRVYKNRGQLIP